MHEKGTEGFNTMSRYGIVDLVVTTHVVRLKLFRLKAEGVRKARLPYFVGNI
jgi:hypothetical protein